MELVNDLRERLMTDLEGSDNNLAMEASKTLLTYGEYGTPKGRVLLLGGKAALRLGRVADAVVLLYHGLRVAEPQTLLWGELLVNRATACGRHGFYTDSIQAATTFLEHAASLPPAAQAWVAHAHHSLGFVYDRLQQYNEAVFHHQMAVEHYVAPHHRHIAACDLAYSLGLSKNPQAALEILSQVDMDIFNTDWLRFCFLGTRAIVRYHLEDFAGALEDGLASRSLAQDSPTWAGSLSEILYWTGRAAWASGDRRQAASLLLGAAVLADQTWNFNLRDRANTCLTEIMAQGGNTHE